MTDEEQIKAYQRVSDIGREMHAILGKYNVSTSELLRACSVLYENQRTRNIMDEISNVMSKHKCQLGELLLILGKVVTNHAEREEELKNRPV